MPDEQLTCGSLSERSNRGAYITGVVSLCASRIRSIADERVFDNVAWRAVMFRTEALRKRNESGGVLNASSKVTQ
jgi:hypothetical protein